MWSGRAARAAWSVVARTGLIVGVGALAGCGLSLPWSSVPQQNCTAGRQGALGTAGGVIVPLAARDPTDTAHNISALYAVNGADGKLAWSCVSTTYAGWNAVQMVGGVIYALAGTASTRDGAVTHAHAIYAIRPRDGKQLWEYSFMAGYATPPVFSGGLLFTTTMTGGGPSGPPGHNPGPPPAEQWTLLAIHTDSGALAWSKTLTGVDIQAVAGAGRVVVALNNGGNEWSLQAYTSATGAAAWSYQLSHGAADLISLVARDGALYAEVDHNLIALDGASGAIRWSRMIQPPLVGVNSEPGEAQLSASAVIVPVDQGAAAYDLATGAPLWSASLGQEPTIWIAPDQLLYALTRTANNTPDHLSALDAATGHTLWSQDMSKLQSLGLAPVGDGDVYLTTPTRAQLDESVIALDRSGASRWRFDGKSPYNSGDLLANGDALYYIWQSPDAVDGVNQADVTYITSLSASDGTTRWQMALPGVNGDPVEPQLTS